MVFTGASELSLAFSSGLASRMLAFSPFRAVGSLVGDRAASITALYEKPLLMVPVGRTFLLYSGLELQLIRGGPMFESRISAVAQTGKYRSVAEGNRIHCFSHHKLLWTSSRSQSCTSMTMSDEVLVTSSDVGEVVAWEIRSGTPITSVVVPQELGQSVTLAFAPGYNNKVLVTATQGFLVFNYKTSEIIYSSLDHFTFAGGITSSAVHPLFRDVIAVGCANGDVRVIHSRQARVLAEFTHLSGSVSSVSFRTDKDGTLFSATSLGEVAVWDLAAKSLSGIIAKTKQVRSREDAVENAHRGPIHSLIAISGEPLLVTLGADNAICQFRLDTVDGMALLVRERRGHISQCTTAAFFNQDLVLTAGEDQAVRCTHVFSDRASWEMSQGKMGKRSRDEQVSVAALKLPPVSCLASSAARNYQWSSIVSIQESSSTVAGWRLDRRSLENKFRPIKTGVHVCRSIRVSLCGNFAVIGYSSGHLVKLNLQDGSHTNIWRRTSVKGSVLPAHEGSIDAVEIGSFNESIISGSQDGTIRVWSFESCRQVKAIAVGLPIVCSTGHPQAQLIAVACGDFSIRAFSTSSASRDETPVRVMFGHKSPITAVALAPDTYRHIVSASADCGLYLWDFAAGCCVGVFRFDSPARALAFHPDALFLLTVHSGERGAFLWTNNLRYGHTPEVVEPENIAVSEAPLLTNPVTREDDLLGVESEDADLFDSEQDPALKARNAPSHLENISCAGLTRSTTSSAVLDSLSLLDQIKERNQPLLPAKKEKAPFFLETTKTLRPTFIVQQQHESAPEAKGFSLSTKFKSCLMNEDFDGALEELLRCNVHEMDIEVRNMLDDSDGEHDGASPESLLTSLQFLGFAAQRGRSIDAIEAFVGHFLDIHSSKIVQTAESDDRVAGELENLLLQHRKLRAQTASLFDFPICLASTFANAFS